MKRLAADFSDRFDFTALCGGLVTGERIGPLGEFAAYIEKAIPRVEQMTGAVFSEPHRARMRNRHETKPRDRIVQRHLNVRFALRIQFHAPTPREQRIEEFPRALPFADFLVSATNKLNFLAFTTPVLALAGFSVATKWAGCRDAAGTTRYVVCNADEGEPGTFKDRMLLTTYAENLFAGMALCAFVIGAKQGFVYLRAEYRYLLDSLQKTLQNCRHQGLLGNRILGHTDFDFDITTRRYSHAATPGETIRQVFGSRAAATRRA